MKIGELSLEWKDKPEGWMSSMDKKVNAALEIKPGNSAAFIQLLHEIDKVEEIVLRQPPQLGSSLGE